MRELVRVIIRIIFKVFYRTTIINQQNLPQKGAAVLCANHMGELDMFFIGYKTKRLIRWMAKEELFKNPILGSILKWLGAFPVKRGKADVGAIKTAFKLLEKGHILGIFAEGTRTKGKEVNKIKINPGAAMFALKKNVPVIPVALQGSYRIFSRVKVVFGEPFYLDGQKDEKYSNAELIAKSEDIMKRVYGLLEE